MIKFFRHLRQSFISEGKTKKYLLYAIGEIVLVVIGILIALQINNWNENSKLQLRETQILQEINSDLLNTKSEIERTVVEHNKLIQSTQWLLSAIHNKKSYSDSIYGMFSRAGADYQITPKTSSFENLKAVGLNTISNDSIRVAITNIFQLSFKRFLHVGMNSENSQFNIENSLFPHQEKYFEVDFSRKRTLVRKNTDTLNMYQLKIINYDNFLKDKHLFKKLQLSLYTRVSKVETEMEIVEEINNLISMINKELGNPYKNLMDEVISGKTVDEIIVIVKQQDRKNTIYDISEIKINELGYYYLNLKNQDENGLKIFKLNTELYPQAFNAFDSYGECLLLLGDKKNGIIAYKKSLELNPENENAKKVLKKLEVEY